MSWLNFNDSLTSIKGQLTNLASGVLNEGIITSKDEGDDSIKPQVDGTNSNNLQVEKNDDAWFWKPAEENPTSRLEQKVEELEREKKELIASLEQLDFDCQQTTDKLVTLKDDLRADYEQLKTKYDKLRNEQPDTSNLTNKICTLNSQNEKLRASYETLREEHEKLIKELEGRSVKFDGNEIQKLGEKFQAGREEVQNSVAPQHAFELANEVSSLKLENEKLCVTRETLHEENAKLRFRLEENAEKLQESEKAKVENKKLVEELAKLRLGVEKNVAVSSQNEALVASYKTVQEENAKLRLQLEENFKSVDEIEKWKVENQKLVEELLKLRMQVEENSTVNSQNKKLLVSYENLQKENAKLNEQLRENSEKLHEKEKWEVENQKLVKELLKLRLEVEESSTVSSQNEKLLVSYETLQEENSKLDEQLKENSKKLHENEKWKVQKEELEEELQKLRLEVEKNSSLSSQNEKLRTSYEKIKEEHATLVTELKELEAKENKKSCDETANRRLKFENESMAQELQTIRVELKKQCNLHELYMKILTGSMKKYLNADVEEEVSWSLPNEDVKAREFVDKLESLLKFVVELKSKNEILENELYQVKQDKNSAVMEKNFEIEKLLQNSEVLSQEVIAKSRTIKDFEEECNELMKNNEALIAELQSYKSNCGLQTISESNEDNLLLLEGQLENANKRIQDLELVVSDLDNSKTESSLEIETELNYIKKQLNLTGQELNKSKEEYRELLVRYERSQEDNVNLKLVLDKTKLDYENVEYKLTETNVNLESIQEENEISKLRLEKLENRKEDLMNDVELLQNLVDDSKQELSIQEENSKEREVHIRNLIEKLQNAKMCETSLKLQIDTMSKELQLAVEARQMSEVKYQQILSKLQEVEGETMSSGREDHFNVQENLERITKEKEALENAHADLQKSTVELQLKINFLESQLKEVVAFVTTKDEENVKYYNEIQRLNRLLALESEKINSQPLGELIAKNEEIATLKEKNEFLTDKCEVIAKSLLEEQKNVQKALAEKLPIIEREQSLSKELERLRVHLVDIEETYTKDLLESEERNNEMQTKLNEIVRREKDSSSIYTSVSIRANQQVETLQTQLQLVTNQRDELRIKVSNYEDVHNKQIAALTNLQLVLDQFQKDKEKDVGDETERIRRQINIERGIQKELRDEMAVLKSQLVESKQGLQAASRLADQLEKCKQQILAFKELEKNMQEQVRQSEATCKELTTQTDTKVDKTLVKNLMLGYMGSNSGDKNQILKIIATVLDFNQEECDKVNLNKQPGGWLSSILHPQALSSDSDISRESLSQAFVKFLENESKPKVVPNLLSSNQGRRLSTDSNKSTTRQSPLLLSEVVLPTFADFGRSRNSGSILKDVLKDNS